jgi:hypothetical protein
MRLQHIPFARLLYQALHKDDLLQRLSGNGTTVGQIGKSAFRLDCQTGSELPGTATILNPGASIIEPA